MNNTKSGLLHLAKFMKWDLKMKTTTKILSLSLLTLAMSGCVINVKAQRADVALQEDLAVAASGLTSFDIDAGAGSLTILGVDSISQIEVSADIKTTEDKDYVLYLKKSGSKARLVAKHGSTSGYWRGDSPQINLTVKMPSNLLLDIEDGSGDIKVSNINNDVKVDDGSGAASFENIAGDLDIEDGSGNLFIKEVKGDLNLDDGSGELTVSDITGNVRVEDGSGELTIVNVSGKVTIDDGSGDINVNKAGALKIIDSGSGGLSISKVKGKVDIDS